MALGISEAQESKMISARAARNKQNLKVPLLINIKDGRLLPNVPALAGHPAETTPDGKTIPAKKPHPDLRPYTGSPKASLEERMKWLETLGVAPTRREVVLADPEPFDIGLATLDELAQFAKDEYGLEIDKGAGIRAARNAVAAAARKAGAVKEEKLN
jgi:hypothetical protein